MPTQETLLAFAILTDAAASRLLAEQATFAGQLGCRPADALPAYLGASEELSDTVLDRYHGGP